MGWKGNLRKLRSTARKIDRANKRHQKELGRRQKEAEKIEELEQAAYDVEIFNTYIGKLQSLHKQCIKAIDWNSIERSQPPTKPTPSNSNELLARQKFEEFKPNLLHKILGKSDSTKSKLKDDIQIAMKKDKSVYEKAKLIYQNQLLSWKSDKEIVSKLKNNNPEAIMNVIRKHGHFNDISELGSKLSFKIIDGILHIEIEVHGSEIVPDEIKSLLKSGKLSVKKMPKGRYYEIYQDYVCSCLLRVSRDIYALLPIDAIILTAVDEMLNTSTGNMEKQPILSVMIPRATLMKMNMDRIDPSDSMSNFIHNMDFKKTKGFMPVKKVQMQKQ